jgi:ketosteroid isomerase-like protein
MDVQELIKRGYRALGLGADDDVLALFDQLGGEPADWAVYEMGAFGRSRPAGDVVAMELFGGLPSHFEVIGVELRTWSMNRRRTTVTVIGRYRARVRGTWEVLALPFTHIWHIPNGRVDKVVSLLDGVEIRRLAPARAAGSRS